jgi:flavin reductase (DIM6/NTAB) family NADH-FMN oxidoreductase RutF
MRETHDPDAVLATMNGALVIVTTASNGQRAGCVVGFHVQCSIEPIRYAVWLSKANHTYRVALFATHMAVHAVSSEHRALVELFGGTSGDTTDKFAACEWSPGTGGVPLLAECPTVMLLARHTAWDDGGDHVCFVGTPIATGSGGRIEPVRLADVADLVDAGHDARERPVPDLTAS